MLDIKFIRENVDLIKQNNKNKGYKIDVDHLLELDKRRRELLQETETLRAEQKSHNEEISKAAPAAKKTLTTKMKTLSAKIDAFKPELTKVEAEFDQLMLLMPQIADGETPIGKDSDDNVVVFKHGEPTKFSFKPKSHIELVKDLDIVDFERGVKVMGYRGYYLKNDGARLEMALLQYGLDFIRKKGFQIMSVPVLAPEKAFYGTGHLPFGGDEIFKVYERDQHTYNLVGSSEVTLCAYHMDEILPESALPTKMSAWSPCFRTEVGSYGKDAKGLYRIKQFYKVEQVVLCKADLKEGKRMLKEILTNSEDFLKSLNLPYQIIRNCTGDMGAGKIEMYDIETWMPSREGYGETHSCSYLGDWQARRLKIRYKNSEGKTQFVHTLNNTLVASPRILIPLLEINQQKDCSVKIPEVLRPYMGGQEVISPI